MEQDAQSKILSKDLRQGTGSRGNLELLQNYIQLLCPLYNGGRCRMKLYKMTEQKVVSPGTSESDAKRMYHSDGEYLTDYGNVKILILEQDYGKVFRMGRLLNANGYITDDFMVEVLKQFCKGLGYTLTDAEVFQGFVVWIHRAEEHSDLEIEEWIK